jgi:diguanylate cyclase (GGDEF)-like protein
MERSRAKAAAGVHRSTVARRFLLLFVFCALFPITALSVLAYLHVTRELEEQSHRRLHEASKATGQAILGRLTAVEAAMNALLEEPGGAWREARPHRLLPDLQRLRPSVRALAIVRDGRARSLIGDIGEPPRLAPAQRAHVESGATWLSIGERGGAKRVLLVRAVDPAAREILVAEVDPSYLLDISHENVLPPFAEFCVLDGHEQAIACSIPGLDALPAPALAAMRTAVSGRFEWKHDGVRYIAQHWSVFLKPRFLHPSWTVVVSEPLDAVRAPIASFRTIFPLVSLLSVLVAALVSSTQIRRRLVPLEKLHDGTRRIAARQFEGRVEIDSGDEFEALASSFNAMADRLREQFGALSTLIEVDRAILSASDVAHIVNILLTRVEDLHPCDVVAAVLAEPDRDAPTTIFLKRAGVPEIERREIDGFSTEELRRVVPDPDPQPIDLERETPRFLEPLASRGVKTAVVLPLLANRQLDGILALGRVESEPPAPETLVYARQLADQSAIAMANARTLEENRVLAYYDALTGLPNRLLLKERLGQALSRARRQKLRTALCLLDLDGFKRINDTLGHDAGDQLLGKAGKRLSQASRTGNIARLGGDEFAILLGELERTEDAARAADRAIAALARPFRLGSREVCLSASVGIAVYPEDGPTLEHLLKNADVAMYHAKEQGGNNYQFYSRAMNEAALKHLSLEQDLRQALEWNEFRLYYQPILEVVSLRVVGMEALIRWQHPVMGLMSPLEFIPLAEETGLIVPLGEWVLRAATSQTRKWQREGCPHLHVAVNLSPRQFQDGGLLATVERALMEADLSPGCLSLEITENVLMQHESETMQTLIGLKRLGARLSIDDFGTGYSSLGYLKHFPVDVLKIDRSFIRDLNADRSNAAITKAVIEMGHSLDLEVVAEGVETEAQLARLREIGCDAAQGYLFATPLPADAFAKFLAEQESD